MSDEPTERDVEALLARARRPMSGQCVICGGTQTVWNLDDHLSCAIDLIEEYAERIAQARREGAAEAASSGYFRGYHDCRDGMQFRDPWRDHVPGAGI